MRYQNPITDRSQVDITNKTAKAFLNVAVWIRIYRNTKVVKALVDFILSVNIDFTELSEPTTVNVPTIAQLNTLLENIENIRQAEGLPSISGIEAIKHDWQSGAGADAPSYIEANQWEHILDTIYNSIASVLDYRISTGVGNTGQPRFYQSRWRGYSWVQNLETPVRRHRAGVAKSGAQLTWNNGYRRY